MSFRSNDNTDPGRKRSRSPLPPLACYSAVAIVNRGLHFLLLPLYLRHIAPEEYGVLTAVTMTAAVIATVSNLKLDAAMRTFYFDYSRDTARLNAYLGQIITASICCAAAVYASMLLAGGVIFSVLFVHEENQFFPAGALALGSASLGACLSPYFAYLRNGLLLRELLVWELSILSGTVTLQILLVAVFDLGIYGILWGSLIPWALALSFLVASRPGLLTTRPERRFLMPSLKFSLPLVGLAFVYTLGTRLDRFVLERHVELETLGAYAVLVGLFGLLGVALNALDNAIRPSLHPESADGGERGGKSVELHHRLYLLAGFLALSLAVFLGSNIHLVTSDPTYVSVEKWLLLGATAFAPVIFARYYGLLHDMHKRSVDLTIGVAARFALHYVLLILLVPRFGLAGALWATFVSGTANAVVFGIAAKRLLGLATPLRTLVSQSALFLGPLWILGYAVGGKPSSTFGVLQLVAVAGLLIPANRDLLRALLPDRKARSFLES